jgi:hypothetical protein
MQASVKMKSKIRWLLKLSNHEKPLETRKPGHAETYVIFSGNLLVRQCMETKETYETYGNYKKLRNYLCQLCEYSTSMYN